MALPPEREASTRIDPAGYLTQFNVLPYLVAVADEVLDLGIEPITPAQLARAAAHAIRKKPVHALEAAVVSMAMLGEGLVETDAARALIRQHLAAIGKSRPIGATESRLNGASKRCGFSSSGRGDFRWFSWDFANLRIVVFKAGGSACDAELSTAACQTRFPWRTGWRAAVGNSSRAHNGHSGGGFYAVMAGIGLPVASGGRVEATGLGRPLVAAA